MSVGVGLGYAVRGKSPVHGSIGYANPFEAFDKKLELGARGTRRNGVFN